MRTVPISQLRINNRAWPRFEADDQRIRLFSELLIDGEELPPIEVVANGDVFVIADGVHRSRAALLAGRDTIEVILVEPAANEDALACAFRRALETATRSALPLNPAERKHAALQLAADRPELSHRAIARLVGVSHDSIDRWLREIGKADEGSDGENFRAPPTADQVARQLVASIARLEDARGLADLFKPSRMGQHLARAFEGRYGDQALKEARRFEAWASRTVEVLEAEGAS
jgi:ParB-like chromosome segregation protein Spo0J